MCWGASIFEHKNKIFLERISTHFTAGKCDAVGDVAFIIPILWWTYLKVTSPYNDDDTVSLIDPNEKDRRWLKECHTFGIVYIPSGSLKLLLKTGQIILFYWIGRCSAFWGFGNVKKVRACMILCNCCIFSLLHITLSKLQLKSPIWFND